MPLEISEQHFVGKVSQRAIIEHEGKFLFTRDHGAKPWGAPGGRLHKEKTPTKGFESEVKEDVGIDIRPERIIHTEVELYLDGTPVFVVYYRAHLVDPNQ